MQIKGGVWHTRRRTHGTWKRPHIQIRLDMLAWKPISEDSVCVSTVRVRVSDHSSGAGSLSCHVGERGEDNGREWALIDYYWRWFIVCNSWKWVSRLEKHVAGIFRAINLGVIKERVCVEMMAVGSIRSSFGGALGVCQPSTTAKYWHANEDSLYSSTHSELMRSLTINEPVPFFFPPKKKEKRTQIPTSQWGTKKEHSCLKRQIWQLQMICRSASWATDRRLKIIRVLHSSSFFCNPLVTCRLKF